MVASKLLERSDSEVADETAAKQQRSMPMKPVCQRRFLKVFAADEQGAMTVLAVVFFVIILGVAGLVIDLGRLYNLHTQMQSFVDSVALASAAELDGNSGALNRAASAAVGNVGGVAGGPLTTGVGNLTAGPTAFAVQRIDFFSSIVADPTPPTVAAGGDVLVATYENGAMTIAGGLTQAQADIRAKYAQVTAASMQLTYFILPLANAVLGASLPSSQAIALQAIAGFKREICNTPPIVMCNPYENVGTGDFTPVRGLEIIAHQEISAGNYGVLCPNGNACRDMLGKRNPNTQCFSLNLPGKPGLTTGPVQVGFNTRFDMYDSPYKSNVEGADPEFAPAKNTTRGRINNPSSKACNDSKSPTSIPQPDDNCFMLAPTPNAGTGCMPFPGTSQKSGDGQWDRAAYWANNHPGQAQPPNYATMSRYDLYLYEISTQPVNRPDETSAPHCSSQSNVAMDPNEDRRVLIAAIVNCATDDTKVIAIGTFFMVQPLSSVWDNVTVSGFPDNNIKWPTANQTDLRLEMIGRITPNEPDGILKELPALFR